MKILLVLTATLLIAIPAHSQNAQQNNQQSKESQRTKPAPQTPANMPVKGWVMTAAPPVGTNAQRSGGHQRYNHTSTYSDSADYYSPYYTPNGDGAYAHAYAANRGSFSDKDARAQEAAAMDDRSVPWEPSIYMDYDQAVKLGKEQQAAAAPVLQTQTSSVPLGDVARNLRKAKQATPADKPLIRQTSEGKLEVCKADATACHLPA